MGSSLENLVTQIQALSGSVEDIAHLHTILKTADESLHSTGEPALLVSFLDQVDPCNHSLGYLFILEAFTSGRSRRSVPPPLCLSSRGSLIAVTPIRYALPLRNL
ncbi:hypothetical protein MLD38_001053 [Melastoma candidum]|uniref:Uncharacterized protein n=1 Tax=Melastoma candidum TaxID=119954 RepID=A0ACB9SCF6_9MYRT|nr:hypothetical protein MLD38_001053 [Melastoma candidum]